jgi:ribosomal protein L7/L12
VGEAFLTIKTTDGQVGVFDLNTPLPEAQKYVRKFTAQYVQHPVEPRVVTSSSSDGAPRADSVMPTDQTTSTAWAASNTSGSAEMGEAEVFLAHPGKKKIQVIQLILKATGLGLKDAKALADSPSSIGVFPRDSAERLVLELQSIGAQCQLRPGDGAIDAASSTGPAPAEPESGPENANDVLEQIRKLGELRAQGILTHDEFEAKKTELLGRL